MARKKRKSRRKDSDYREQYVDGYCKSRPEIETVHPKTENQRIMMEAIVEKDIIIANGTAGSGKTFIALYQAVQMLEHNWMDTFLYIKPNVDFKGERGIGFLQGNTSEKMMPLFMPIMDNLKFCTPGKRNELLAQNKLQIGLLEYLRGRSLKDTFVFFDEVQNTDVHAVKTVISRIEEGSKVVIAGDISQSDTGNSDNGLKYCLDHLSGDDLSDLVEIINFTQADNVRNPRLNRVLSKFP